MTRFTIAFVAMYVFALGWLMMLSGGVAQAQIIDVSVTTDKPSYLPLEPIEVSVTATNPNDFDVTLGFSSSYQAGYLMDGVYDWAFHKAFAQVITAVSIEAGDSYTWNFGHDWDEYFLSLGVHSLTGYVVGYGQSQPVGFQVTSTPPPPPPPTFTISELLIDSPPETLEFDGNVEITAGAKVDVSPGYTQASATLETILAVPHSGTLSGLFTNEGEHLRDGIFVDAIAYDANDVTVDLLQAAPGDLNGDRLVDGTDVLAILTANSFDNPGAGPGPSGEWFWEHGDNNGDGLVDNKDILNILAANLFGTGAYAGLPAGAAVPEPSSLVLAGFALVGLLVAGWRRRRA